jgi:5-hydroxyisourate hydrolase
LCQANYHTQKTRVALLASYNCHLEDLDARREGAGMGRLTTHILDTTGGCPAAGVDIRLFHLSDDRELLASAISNMDGRTEEPLLENEVMRTGTYELEFGIGSYFAASGAPVDDPPFLDTVVIRFSIKADENYHVPLLVSPWSYSTYRGS